MAKAAEHFAPVFVSAGLPVDFVAQLNAATRAMQAAGNARMQSRGRRGGATQGLKERLAIGRRAVRVLDAFVKSALKDNSSLLANWRVVKRVQKVAGRSAQPVVAPPPAPTPVTHTAPVSTPTPVPA